MRHPTAGWGIRRGLRVHGVKEPLAYVRLTPEYSWLDAVLTKCKDSGLGQA